MSAPPREGAVLGGRYRVERVVGRGGAGVVVAARHLGLDELVAVKVVGSGPEASRGRWAERLVREARLSFRIRSEHVVRVLDAGRTDEGAPFVVMELLEGRDLGRELLERGRLAPAEAAGYVLEACDGVASAHAVGVVHRDLKPSNLFLARQIDGTRRAKVLDFGLSLQLGGDGDEGLTDRGTLLGSPPYMSPEQIEDAHDVGYATDLWSLGVTLFQALTGAPPFAGPTTSALFGAILRGEAPEARRRAPEVPAALDEVVARCLRRAPGERWPSAAALGLALAPFVTAGRRPLLDRLAAMPPPAPGPAGPPRDDGPAAGPPLAPTEAAKR